MTDWKPIETAPKDGTEVLVWGYGQMSVAKFISGVHGEWKVYTSDGWYGYDSFPTHWMPLPKPPEMLGDVSF